MIIMKILFMKGEEIHKDLLIAIGNYSRGDDALGWLFADHVAQLGLDIKIEYRYQLQVEDAELLQYFDRVIFTDASKVTYPSGFHFYPIHAAMDYTFTTHSVSAGTLLQLASELYHSTPEAHMMAVSGTAWGLGKMPGKTGKDNLRKALSFFEQNWLPCVDSP